MMKARCHSTIARTIPFSGGGWRHGVARARNWHSFVELSSNPSTHKRLSADLRRGRPRPPSALVNLGAGRAAGVVRANAKSALRTCSAEDLIVLKLFAFRPRDVLDAETIVIRQRAALDWQYIAANLQPLAEVKDEPGIMAAFEKLRRAG